ncbi:MAG: ATP synthase F1 subunit gamma [Elusimicrobia bacterium]|jgi:F-type H+-transporting ATPase subunit gamma|nr:ATP synthase F1 subunit gamma [Elusimicrobiota bacterium]
MASLRDIRRKIKSVKSTEQITRAMKMVAAARMRRSQGAILSARPFAVKMEELIRDLHEVHRARAAAGSCPEGIRDFFEAPAGGAAGLILITGDKGLCGAFNTTLLRAALDWLRSHAGRKTYLAVVGRKGRDFARRLRGDGCEVVFELVGIFPKAGFHHAELLGKALLSAYREKGLSQWDIIYNEFKSAAQQRLVRETFLPAARFEAARKGPAPADFGFEPDYASLLQALLPRYIKAQLYRRLLESQAAELSARMNAMDAASKNAAELMESLNMAANRQRQAVITKEIAELVGGAEALAA